MSRIWSRLVAVLLVLGVLATPVRGGEKKTEQQDASKNHAVAHRAATVLVQDLERLQEDVVQFLVGPKATPTYRAVEAVLRAATQLKDAVKPGAETGTLLRKHAEFEHRLTALLKTIRALGPEQRVVQRSADHVRADNEELFYLLVAGSPGAQQTDAALRRQAEALAQAARNLELTARASLQSDLSRKVLSDDIKKLAQQSERFAKGLGSDVDRQAAAKHFAAIDQAYAMTVQQMNLLAPGENLSLLRAASRFDRLYGRLHRLLGIQGKRTQLVVPS
jgi:hypothetical protein